MYLNNTSVTEPGAAESVHFQRKHVYWRYGGGGAGKKQEASTFGSWKDFV